MDGAIAGVFQGQARFGFTYSCDMTKDNRAEIRGQITYHDDPSIVAGVAFPEIRIHGTVDPEPVDGVMSCAEAAEAYEGLGAARFHGTYRSQDDPQQSGRLTVLVFDQSEPGRSVGEVTGDGFSIELIGGAYDGYTRAGYLEGGNIQVK